MHFFLGSWFSGVEDVVILSTLTKFSYYFLSADPVRFIASASGSPDLPPWLRFEQKDPTDRAFIYGTPGREVSSQIVLEVRKVFTHVIISYLICNVKDITFYKICTMCSYRKYSPYKELKFKWSGVGVSDKILSLIPWS